MQLNHRSILVVALAIALPVSSASAAERPTIAAPASFKLVPTRIDRALRQMVARQRVAGAAVLIWKSGREAYFGTSGYADREAKRPFTRDTLTQVWSMTKPLTGVALMTLWEQGRFSLDEPLAKYLPEYADVKVFGGTDSSGKPILEAPTRPISIRDIMRHTAGFVTDGGPAGPEKIFADVDPLNLGNTLDEFSRKLTTVPLAYNPGTQWRYSPAVDVQARLVEKLSGEPFETYVRSHVFEPLRMRDSAWTQPEARYARLAAAYAAGPDGKLIRKSEADVRRFNFGARKLTRGGAGIATTMNDYLRFARMLLNHGTLDGVRILKPSTVKLMSTNQLDPMTTERDWLPSKGNGGFGFDFFVRTGQPKDADENRGTVGEFWWDGAWSTLFWIDPANDMIVLFFTQKEPWDGTLHHDIREAVYGADYLGPKGD
jgi:CubicO group peptidase (beta-lactamase class C family)